MENKSSTCHMTNEKRLIDANARIEEIRKTYCTNCDNYGGVRCRSCWVDDGIGFLEDAPTVDAVEVVHGRWIATDYKPYIYCKCSVCGRRITIGEKSNYCPNCGAKMDEEGRKEE